MVTALHIPVALKGAGYIRSELRHYMGRVVDVDWQAILALQQVDIALMVVMVGDDPVSEKATSVVANFVAYRRLDDVLVLGVTIGEDAASELGVAVVPQIRLYRNGREIRRHRGLASYTVLEQLLGIRER